MLRIVPTTHEELQKVQELQDLEDLQVRGEAAGVAFGDTPKLTSLALQPPRHTAKQGWGWVGDNGDKLVICK